MKQLINRTILGNALKGSMSLSQVIGRGTGRTEGQVLHHIAEAIRCPGEVIPCRDHAWPTGMIPKDSMLRELRYRVEDAITRLGLKDMTVKVKEGSVQLVNNFAEVIG